MSLTIFKKVFVFWMFCLLVAVQAKAQVYDAIIAKDGSGNYTSIQTAVTRIRSNQSGRYLFYVKAGVYEEKVNVTLANVSLVGEDVDKVIVSWGDYSGDAQNHSTSTSYSFETGGDNFYAENITFKNTAGNVGQAVALNTTGKNQIFKHCKMIGFQDTYYAKKGIQYNVDCYIEGATDFIFGESTAVFDNCEIRCVAGGQYVTAPADTKLISTVNGVPFYHGLLFLDSKITKGSGVANNSYYLGRPWQPNSSSVYINCTYDNHIRSEGWSTWSNDNHLSSLFAEYGNVDMAGKAIDISGRASWSKQLSTKEVTDNYNLDFFLKSWNPKSLIEATAVPKNLQLDALDISTKGFSFLWDASENALGYAVIRNDSVIAFVNESAFSDPNVKDGDIYEVVSINKYGSMSTKSTKLIGQVILSNSINKQLVRTLELKNGVIDFHQIVNAKLISISGQILITKENIQQLDLTKMKKGLYILGVENNKGEVVFQKLSL
jgi:pectin methylesterase-like acyl-CoA thioesterase